MHPMLNTAIRAARRAGTVIMRHLDRIERLTVETKGRSDFVSEVDRLAEAEIIQILHAAYPQHGILAEETGSQPGDEYLWIIDPLDGTTNFLHRFPQFAVSIGLLHRGRLEQAVVFDPYKNEIFTASRGGGAQLNDRRIRVSRAQDFESSLLATGFPFRSHEHLETWINTLRDLLRQASDVRRAGSASLDLAYVACGRLDAFWEFGLKPWDMAAGALLVLEAGGLVSDFAGSPAFLDHGQILAGTPRLHEMMLPVIQRHVARNA